LRSSPIQLFFFSDDVSPVAVLIPAAPPLCPGWFPSLPYPSHLWTFSIFLRSAVWDSSRQHYFPLALLMVRSLVPVALRAPDSSLAWLCFHCICDGFGQSNPLRWEHSPIFAGWRRTDLYKEPALCSFFSRSCGWPPAHPPSFWRDGQRSQRFSSTCAIGLLCSFFFFVFTFLFFFFFSFFLVFFSFPKTDLRVPPCFEEVWKSLKCPRKLLRVFFTEPSLVPFGGHK